MNTDMSNRLLRPAILGLCCGLVGVSARADAPPGRYKLDATGATVLDVKTGLVWQRTQSDKVYPALEPGAYCVSLSLGGFKSGWRVPTKKELESVVDVSYTDSRRPTIDPIFDSPSDSKANPKWDFYCTSSRYLGLSFEGQAITSSWWVNFSSGSTGYAYRPSDMCWVRCVR